MFNAHWQAFLAASVLLALTPGANQLLSLRNALQQGTADAVVALAGRFSAFLVLILATVAGLGAILLASEPVFTAVKWCGVAYLLYLGGRMLYRSRTHAAEPAREGTADVRRTRRELTRQEFGVAMTNPKALLLFGAFLPQFADRSAGAVPAQLLALGLAYIAVEFAAALVYAGVGGRLASFDLTARTRRWFDRATGVTMLAIAASLTRARP
ncbi:LysE family translocator [Actinomadura algeriensis]|uniref:Threonine/homoserine/homoserine lactone efflux protein n=1 Tax=Actinomadura algeriensis TaxID=1679523 RepID=A0ABR9JW62_9ACTN|nr:LysE family translocator [Actinomadura algeriensis]MBE1534375.1 threonine/homoserine/homoserine lactone efflux protein [Actinomadura algeriensis]